MILNLTTTSRVATIHGIQARDDGLWAEPEVLRNGTAPESFIQQVHLAPSRLTNSSIADVFLDEAALGEFGFHALSTDTGNERHITVSDSGEKIGLHLDNWDRRPLVLRPTSRTRLVLNLGPGSRAVFVGDVDICAALREVGSPPTHVPHTRDLAHLYLSGHLREVYCLTLQPLDGYLMQTDCVVHDGSTHVSCDPSTTVHFMFRA